jgi:hypothetical protein
MPKTRREIAREVDEIIRSGPLARGGRGSRSHRARHVELLIGLTASTEISSPLVEAVPGGSSNYVRAVAERLPSLIRPEGNLQIVAVSIGLPPRSLFSRPAPPGRWSLNLVAVVADTTAPAEYWLKEAKKALAPDGEWREMLRKKAVVIKRVDHLQLAGGIC